MDRRSRHKWPPSTHQLNCRQCCCTFCGSQLGIGRRACFVTASLCRLIDYLLCIIFELEGKRALVCAASSVAASLVRETCDGICCSLFDETHRACEKAAPLLTALGRTRSDYCISIILEIAPLWARVNRSSCTTARVLVATGSWAEGTCHVLILCVASWTCVC